jgi:hypothetical protein
MLFLAAVDVRVGPRIIKIHIIGKYIHTPEELDSPVASALRRAIAEIKQRWSVIGCVTKNALSRVLPFCGMHIKPLVPAAFAVVSTHQSTLPAWWIMARSPYV